MAKHNFQHHYSSLQSHDPSEIILKCWFNDQETFLLVINSQTTVGQCLIFLWNLWSFFIVFVKMA